MNLLINSSPLALWHDVIKHAENESAINLDKELENYLVSLLVRYTNKPEIANQVLATAFLEALQLEQNQRHLSLQNVGDQCLLFAGLFPQIIEKRCVKLSYFVDLGRSSYAAVSHHHDLFGALAMQFVMLMDVLQSIRHHSQMTPIEAYDQWHDVGSQRALKILKEYTHCTFHKKC